MNKITIKTVSILLYLLTTLALTAEGSSEAKGNHTPLTKIVSKWVRTDGGYTIEIAKLLKDGKLEAHYFNPSPIPVTEANVTKKETQIEVFIQLDGPGYKGSKYTLWYNADLDALAGKYFQGSSKQTYQVMFQRK